MSPVTVLLPSLFPSCRLKIQVEEAAFSSGWVQPSWAKTELLEWGKKSASCWQAAQAQQLLGAQAVILGESCPRQQHMYQKGGLGCAKAHTAQTSPLSQLLYLRIFLPSLQVIAAKRTNSSWHVKARKEEMGQMVSLCLLPGHLCCATGRRTGHQTGATMCPCSPRLSHSLLDVHGRPGLLHMVIIPSNTHHQGLGPIVHPHQTLLAKGLRAGLETC